MAADRNHERVVGNRAARNDFLAVLVAPRAHRHFAARAVEAFHFAELEVEMVPARLRQIVELVLIGIHAAGRDFVQQRFPQMRARAVDQRDASMTFASGRVAKPGGELEPARAAADDYDMVDARCCRHAHPRVSRQAGSLPFAAAT